MASATTTTTTAAAAADSPPPLPLSTPPEAAPPAPPTTKPQPLFTRLKPHLTAFFSACRKQWFLIALLLSVAFAAALPQLGSKGGWLRAEFSVRIPAIVLIFLISGSGLKTSVLARAAGNLQAHALVQGVSLGITPLVGWAVGSALRASGGLPRPLADGVVVMACMPTTISTNVVYTDMAGGNESIALVNAVLGNLIGIFISPAWITALVPHPAVPPGGTTTTTTTTDAASLQAAVPYASVLGELGYLVLAPLIAGQLLQYFAPKAVSKVRSKINLSDVSSLCIVLIVWISFCNTFSAARLGKGTPTTPADAAAAFFLCAALLVAFALIAMAASRLPVPMLGGRKGEEEEEEVQEDDGKKAAATTTTTPRVVAIAASSAAEEEGRAPAPATTLNGAQTTTTAARSSSTTEKTTTTCPLSCHRLPRADAVAVVICGATKTLALGAPLISVMYGKSDDVGLVALPLVVYHALQCVFGAPLLGPLRRWRHGELEFRWRCWRRAGGKKGAAADDSAAAAPAAAQA